jgi:hypothetical protein
MHRGYSLCSADLEEVLCLSDDKQSLFMGQVSDTAILNSALCLPDLTEAKNILKRVRTVAKYAHVVKDLEVHNIARLYNKFY